MKETGTLHWSSPNTGATNSSGFTALSGAYRDIGGAFNGLCYHADFWSSTASGPSYAWSRFLSFDNDRVGRYEYYRTLSYSVRCIKD